MFLAIWITCGAVLAAVLVRRLRVAAVTLRTILDEPSELPTPSMPSDLSDLSGLSDHPDLPVPPGAVSDHADDRPMAATWHHPPRRLWADR